MPLEYDHHRTNQYNGYQHHLPKLNGAPQDGARTEIPVSRRHEALPAIPTSVGNDGSSNFMAPSLSVKHLLTRNGNLSPAEEEELIRDLTTSLQFIDDRRLNDFRADLANYDLQTTNIVDASTLQRIFTNTFKQMPIKTSTVQKLTRLFATDPRKPRKIYYNDLCDYMKKIKANSEANKVTLSRSASTGAEAAAANVQNAFYKRGDAKLIMELELAFKEASVTRVDPNALAEAFSRCDTQQRGTVTERDVEQVLRRFALLECVQPLLPQLLQRCEMENQYDWQTLIRFLEKAQPMFEDDPSSRTKPKKDPLASLDLETGFPAIAKLPQGGGANGRKRNAQKTYFQMLQDMNNAVDSQKLSDEAAVQMQTLGMQQKRFEETLARAQQYNRGNSNYQIAAFTSESSTLPELFANSSQPLAKRPTKKEMLIDELRNLDQQNHGYIPMDKAMQLVERFNETHKVSANTRFLESALKLNSNDNGTHVNLRELINYLNTVMQ